MNISERDLLNLITINPNQQVDIPDKIDYKQFITLPKHELFKLKDASDLIRSSENSVHCELTPELLKYLIVRFKSSVEWSFNSKLKFDWFREPYTGACGCTGARDGEPYCNCMMIRLCYVYRFDVALAILEEPNV